MAVKIKVEFNGEAAEYLEGLMADQGLTLPEVIQKALALYTYVAELKKDGTPVGSIQDGRFIHLPDSK